VGLIVEEEWRRLPERFATALLGDRVIMPCHVPGVIWLTAAGAQSNCAATKMGESFAIDHERPTLGQVLRTFKATSTRRANIAGQLADGRLWQRGYHDHIIRTDDALDAIRDYIWENPATWALDRYHPTPGIRGTTQVSPWD
jgi:hypothetical protein